MGDYTKKGVKIGTCGDAYYATLEMLEKASAIDPNDAEVNYYLNPKNRCRFAFPFPEYEGKAIGEISNFHSGQRAEFTFDLELAEGESAHEKLAYYIHPKGAEGLNLMVPCPYTPGDHSGLSFSDKSVKTFRLVGQKYDDNGELLLTAECVYCRTLNVFSNDESLKLAEQLRGEAERQLLYAKESNRGKMEDSIKFAEYRLKIVNKILEMVQRNQDLFDNKVAQLN